VVTVAGQRMHIRIRTPQGTKRLIWTQPRRLRDRDTWAAIIAAGTVVGAAPLDEQQAGA
jgi:hypothetical protein